MESWWTGFTGESLETRNQKLWLLGIQGTDREFPREGIRAMGNHLVRSYAGSNFSESMVGCMSRLYFKDFSLQRDLAFVHWWDKQAGSQSD